MWGCCGGRKYVDLTGSRERAAAADDSDEDGGGAVTGENRETPGLGQRQRKVQCRKIN